MGIRDRAGGDRGLRASGQHRAGRRGGAAPRAVSALAPVTVVVPSNFAGLTARRLLGAGVVGIGGIANVSFVTPFRLAELLAADRCSTAARSPTRCSVRPCGWRSPTIPGPSPTSPTTTRPRPPWPSSTPSSATSSRRRLARIERDGGEAARTAVRFHRAVDAKLDGFHDEADVARAAADRPDLADVLAPWGHVIWYLPAPTTAADGRRSSDAVLASAPSTVIVGVTGDADADARGVGHLRRRGCRRAAGRRRAARPTAARIVSVTDADEEVRAVVRAAWPRWPRRGRRLDRIGVFHPTARSLRRHPRAAARRRGHPGQRAVTPPPRRHASRAARLLDALGLPARAVATRPVMALVSGGPVRAGDGPRAPGRVGDDLPRGRRRAGPRRLASQARRACRARRRRASRDDADAERRCRAGANGSDRDIADVDQLARVRRRRCATPVPRSSRRDGWPAKADAASDAAPPAARRRPPARPVARGRAGGVRAGRGRPRPAGHARRARARSRPTRCSSGRSTAELDVTPGRVGRFGDGVVYGPLAAAVGHDLDAVFVLGCAEGLLPDRSSRRRAAARRGPRRSRPASSPLRATRLDDQHRAVPRRARRGAPGAARLTFARGDLRGNRRALPSRWLLDSASGRRRPPGPRHRLRRPRPRRSSTSFRRSPGVCTAPVHGVARRARPRRRSPAFVDGGGERRRPLRWRASSDAASRCRRHGARRRSPSGTATSPASRSRRPPIGRCRRPASRRWAALRLPLLPRLTCSACAIATIPSACVDLSPLDRGSGVHAVLERFLGEAIDAGCARPDEPWSDARPRPAARDRRRGVRRARGPRAAPVGRCTGGSPRPTCSRCSTSSSTVDDEHRAESRVASRARSSCRSACDDAASRSRRRCPTGARSGSAASADRVDRADDGHLLVSDYKTGKGDEYVGIDEGDPVREGTTLQLGLYAEAARQLLGATSTEAHYWMVDPRAGYERRGYAWTAERRAALRRRGRHDRRRHRGRACSRRCRASGTSGAAPTRRAVLRLRRALPARSRRAGRGQGRCARAPSCAIALAWDDEEPHDRSRRSGDAATWSAATGSPRRCSSRPARARARPPSSSTASPTSCSPTASASPTSPPSRSPRRPPPSCRPASAWRSRSARATTTDDARARALPRRRSPTPTSPRISTLHGFASRLLGEFPVAAGLPPRVRVLDEVSSQLALEDRWERFVDELYDDPANEPLLVRAALVGVALEPQYQGHATFKDVAVELNQNWDRLDRARRAATCRRSARSTSRRSTTPSPRSHSLPDECIDPDDLLLRPARRRALLPEMLGVVAIDRSRPQAARCSPQLATRTGAGGDGGKARGVGRRRQGAPRQRVDGGQRRRSDEVVRSRPTRCCAACSVLVVSRGARRRRGAARRRPARVPRPARAGPRAAAHRRRGPRARCTSATPTSCSTSSRTPTRSRSSWPCSIAGVGQGGRAAAPGTSSHVDDGRLFFVGDPKQSIYRFRRADIDAVPRCPRPVRSRRHAGPGSPPTSAPSRPILDWVNALLRRRLMAEEKPGKQPRYEPLVAVARADSGAPTTGRCCSAARTPTKVKAGELREAEADDVAARHRRHPRPSRRVAGARRRHRRVAAGAARRRHHPGADPHVAARTCARRSTAPACPTGSTPARSSTTPRRSATRSPRCAPSTTRPTS